MLLKGTMIKAMGKFKKGDRVEVIDDSEKGIVTKVEADSITVEFEDGFQQDFQTNELIPDKDLNISLGYEETPIKRSDIKPENNRKAFKSSKENYIPEIDLHIHELIDDARRLSNFEILNIQLSRAKGFLDWAISKRFRKIILIHGVGQGVLKEELKTLLRRYDHVEFFDADYQKYGLGATEVRIY